MVDGTAPWALDGFLVLDLGQVYNGPYCGLLLGFMGARVIKVEPPRGDSIRQGPSRKDDRTSFLRLNSNKESVVLNLKDPKGREVLLDLARKADVLVENFKPGVMDRMGLSWKTVHEVNPKLVYASGSAFGMSGPYRNYPGMDVTVQAMSGITSITGFPGGTPVKCGAAVSDFLGGVHLCAGILAALLQRTATGEGQHVEASMYEASVMTLMTSFGAMLDHGPEALPERTGNLITNLAYAPYNLYPAKDGHVTVFCYTERHWERLAELMDRAELAHDPRFATRTERAKRIEEVDAIVGDWTRTRDRAEVMETLNEAGVPCAPVKTLREVSEDPHLFERGAEVRVPHPEKGTVQLTTSPIRLHGSARRGIDRLAPELGQDTDRVLQEVLGMSEGEIEGLHESGVIEPET